MHYTKEYIRPLLDRFMQGETSLEEEAVLAAYFRDGTDVPADWQDYRRLFAELAVLEETPAPATAASSVAPAPATATLSVALAPVTARRRPLFRWVAAAAVVVAVVFAATVSPSSPPDAPGATLVAWQDTVLRPEAPNEELPPDTVALRRQLQQRQPAPRRKRRIRKPEPTIHDYDRAYTLMARTQQERTAGEQAVAQAKQEIMHARMAAYGYMPVMQEDGTIIYIDEQSEYFAYEE